MLYSYQGQEPKPLPFRIRLEDGSTRTSLIELTQEELFSLGFTGPYTIPAYNSETEQLIWSPEDLQYQIIPIEPEPIVGFET